MVDVTYPLHTLLEQGEVGADAFAGERSTKFSELLDLARKTYPHMRFHRTNSHTAWIYFDPSDFYAVACISYDDVRQRVPRGNDSPKRTYNLYSRTVENTSQSMEGLANRLKKFTSPKSLVAELATHVVSLWPREVVVQTTSKVTEVVDTYFRAMTNELSRARRDVGLLPGSQLELFVLSGRADTDPALRAVKGLPEFLDKQAAFAECDFRSKTVTAVYIDGDTAYTMGMITSYGYAGNPQFRPPQDKSELIPIPVADLEPEIRSRIDVLGIVEILEFVPNIGIKYNNRLFYVVI